MRSDSHYRSEYQKQSRGRLFGGKRENAWGAPIEEIFEPVNRPVINCHQAFKDGTMVIMHDNCMNIETTVICMHSPNRYSLLDCQGFIHIAEVLTKEDRARYDGADMRAIVVPNNKYSAGYSQMKNKGVGVSNLSGLKMKKVKVQYSHHC